MAPMQFLPWYPQLAAVAVVFALLAAAPGCGLGGGEAGAEISQAVTVELGTVSAAALRDVRPSAASSAPSSR
jgi:hypothetical protein